MRAAFFLPALLLTVSVGPGSPVAASTPPLAFEGPERYRPLIRVLDGVVTPGTERAMDLVGLAEPGPPIRVVLAPRDSEAARRAPSWASAYAFGAAGLVVLLPDRIPSYPDRTLEEVLLHEITHVLVSRAAGRRPVPRWLDEGLALQAARPWNIDDQARLIRVSLGGRPPRLETLDRLFRQGRSSAASAYAVSGAFVRYLMESAGEAAPARVLYGLREGRPFDEAFRRATGRLPDDLEAEFLASLEPARLWLPLLTDPTTLWIGISALAVIAWMRIRQRRAERDALWIEEEQRALEELRRRTERRSQTPSTPDDPTPDDADGDDSGVWYVPPGRES